MTDGLKDKHRAAIVAAIAANDRVERAVLFGSRATGTNTATSDVDIALFGDLLTLTDQAYLAAALDEIPMAQSVHLLLYNSIQSRILREHIRRQGIEWYAQPPRGEGDDTASDSGAEWPVVKLEEVSSDEPGAIAIGPFGSRMKSDVYTLSGVPIIRGTNISTSRAWRNEWVYVSDDFADGLPNCNVREGDLVFPHRGSIGEVAIIPGDRDRYMLSTSLMKFRPDPNKVSPLFLFYYFRSDTGRSEIMQYSSQVGTPGIGQPLTSLRQFQVPIPPREEQERIADILSTLDDKIELNRRVNQTLEEMAQALFKSWFVDFDPVHAKATLKHHDTVTPSQGGSDWSVERARAFLDRMDPNIDALFPDSFVDSQLGPIPEGWEVGAMGKRAGQRRCGVHPQHIDPGTPYIALEHMPRRCIALSEWDTADGLASSKFRFEERDILFGKLRPYFHKIGVAPLGGVCSTDIVVISPVSDDWFGFVLGHASSSEFVDYTDAASTGTKMPRTNWTDMSCYQIPLPSQKLAECFNKSIQPAIDRIVSSIHESRSLTAVRETLLPKIISGELRVGVAADFVGDIVTSPNSPPK